MRGLVINPQTRSALKAAPIGLANRGALRALLAAISTSSLMLRRTAVQIRNLVCVQAHLATLQFLLPKRFQRIQFSLGR